MADLSYKWAQVKLASLERLNPDFITVNVDAEEYKLLLSAYVKLLERVSKLEEEARD